MQASAPKNAAPKKTGRSKGRPRSFDREIALGRAMGVFWRRGYEPASIAELCAAMEINPPSLYAAFGNKAQLFMEAARHYKKVYWDPARARLAAHPDIHAGMAGFFREAACILTSQDVPSGCLIILAATNVSAEDEAVNDALGSLRKDSFDCFLTRIERAIGEGQLPADTDAGVLAAAFDTVLEGMSLRAREGASRSELEHVGTIAMRMFHNAGSTPDRDVTDHEESRPPD